MSVHWQLVFLFTLFLTIFFLSNESQAEVWIPENEFTSYIDANGFYTVIGAIKNTEEFSVSPTVIINIQDGEKLITKTYKYVAIQPSQDLPFKIKLHDVSNSAILLEPVVTFTQTEKTPIKIEILYDKTLIKYDDGHLTGRIINNGNSTVHNIKIFALIHGHDKILDMGQSIEMIEKMEPGEIRSFSMYPDPSINSPISYYSCFAPNETTIVPVTAVRNAEKFFFRYDAGTWYYDAQFNDAGTELTMKTQTSFNLDTYASFEFPYYVDNEKFQVFINDEKKESIQSIDEMGNWHVSFGVAPRETGILKITGFEPEWKPIETGIIPNWVRNTAEWWSNDRISDDDFANGIQFLINEKIMIVPDTGISSSPTNQIPNWVKNNAGWWVDGIISDIEFTKSIEFLIKTNVIRLDSGINTSQLSSKTLETIPAASSTILNFYVNDQDLNTSPNGIDTISTEGLIQVTINGVLIESPSQMVETTPNSGKFFLKITLPETVNGKPLQKDDIVLVKYIDQSDHAGDKRTIEKSVVLSSSFAEVESSGGGNRIGWEFTVRLYEPDANRDSKDEDKIPLSTLEFRAEGGIRTTLANPVFKTNSAFLIETKSNSNIFEVKITIPRSVDGKTIHIGDWYEIRYFDSTNPSETTEKIILKGRIG